MQFDDHDGLHAVASGTPEGDGEDHEWLGRWGADRVFLGAVAHAHQGARAVAVLPRADGVLVLGSIDTSATAPVGRRPFLHRYDADGEALWTRTLELDVDVASVESRALAVDCAGRILVLATHDETPWIIRLDQEGNELDRLEPLAGELWSFHAMAPDPAGNPVVVGRGWDETLGESFVVRKIAG